MKKLRELLLSPGISLSPRSLELPTIFLGSSVPLVDLTILTRYSLILHPTTVSDIFGLCSISSKVLFASLIRFVEEFPLQKGLWSQFYSQIYKLGLKISLNKYFYSTSQFELNLNKNMNIKINLDGFIRLHFKSKLQARSKSKVFLLEQSFEVLFDIK